MTFLRSQLLFCTLFIAAASAAPMTQVDYTLNLGNGTLNGNNVTSLMIFETDGTGAVNLDFPFTVTGSGTTILSHMVSFVPTTSLIIGLDLASASDPKTHLVFFTDPDFPAGLDGQLFSAIFPNTRHNDFINRLLAAQAGDAGQIAYLTNFFLTGDGSTAAFDTGITPVAVEFSVITVLTPEPQSFALLGLGLLGILTVKKRR
jgi:hypothetical protein